MRQVLGWMTVVILCCAAGAAATEEKPDARLQEAQGAYDEAKKLWDAGKYTDAIARGERALALREAVLGGAHPEVARCIYLLGVLHNIQGELDKAEPLLQRALELREAALGKNHPDVADSLNGLGGLYLDQAAYDRAEPLFSRALVVWEDTLGKNHPKVAIALNNLANVYLKKGQYERAASFYQRAISLDEESFGKNDPRVADGLDNLASLYTTQGLYGQAGPLFERALAIRENALGKDHVDVGKSLNNLGFFYAELGLYGRAEPLYERALVVWEATVGKTHPYYAQALHNLANLYTDQGMYSRAEPLYERVRSSFEAAFGGKHAMVGRVLANMGRLHAKQKLFARAEPLFEQALTIVEESYGKDHPDVAAILHNLATLFLEQGQPARARPLLERALAIRETALGKQHPLFATSLENLANLYRDQGRYERARPIYARALAIEEAALGKDHALVAESLKSEAQLYLAWRRLDKALPLYTRALAISERRLRQEALAFSETRLASFLQLLRSDEEQLYALLRAHPNEARMRHLALGAALLLKGRSLEEMAGISRVVNTSLGAEDRHTFERLRELRSQVAALSLRGQSLNPPTDYPRRMKELTEAGDALEANLATRSAPLRALSTLPALDEIVPQVARSLPKDGALIEFIAYQDRPLVPTSGTSKSMVPGHPRYLALVLFPDASTRAVDLGPAEPMDRAVSNLREALANRDVSFQSAAQALYRLAFQPLRPVLGNRRHLFLSPDGQLAVVPFAALHDGREFLVDSYDFTSLTSGRELLPAAQEVTTATSVVVIAAPDFRAPPSTPPASKESVRAQTLRSASLERFSSTVRADVAKLPWSPLPGTRQEAEALHRLFPQAQLFLGEEASKERLLSLPPPGILHLATHGFFLEDAPVPQDSRAVGHFGALGEEARASRPMDPLLRSGLVLASARTPEADDMGDAKAWSDRTLVTALELAGMNLWGTQLVVLSACDTGRGDVKLGQGVYGLRRALVAAGAETVVMSLWKVNDETTRQLMEAYYGNLLAGQGRAGALRAAMRSLRQTQPHPHYWAPFIVQGRDTPLRSLGPSSQGAPAQ